MGDYKFYFETNSLYSIGKIKPEIIESSFTSAFALFEIVSNITERNYSKRKSILNKIFERKIEIDWQFPQEIIFNSFDYFQEYEFVESRIERLNDLISLISKSESYEDLIKINTELEFGLSYFEEMDKYLGDNFVSSSMMGNLLLKEIFNTSKEPNSFSISGKTYEISDYNDLRDFFKNENSFNTSTTVLALAKMMKSSFPNEVEDEDDLELLYDSYNGLVDIYVQYFSGYCSRKFVEKELPAINDFTDLTHLIYLRDDKNITIISDDKIFENMKIGTITSASVL